MKRTDNMIEKLLSQRNLPPLLPRDEMLEILRREIYGTMPEKPKKVEFIKRENIIPKFCAGKAQCDEITVKCTVYGREFSFPIYATIPAGAENLPFFIHINFRPDNPDRYMPTEEIIDNGFALISFCYKDVTSDDGDFEDGISGVFLKGGKREPDSPGKIALWAWAAQRALDYAQTLTGTLDMSRACVCGHSRLGKTALLAAATDERFAFAYSNDSGCSGAALARGTTGERPLDIITNFPFWFCENYYKYADDVSKMPFDQHYLVASIAPRYVLIGSASENDWADPVSEFLTCAAASPAFENEFKCEDRLPQVDDLYFDGDVGYQLRKGLHYFGREDWQRLIKFINLKS